MTFVMYPLLSISSIDDKNDFYPHSLKAMMR